MKLGAAAHDLAHVLVLADTPVDYIRLGYPYCPGLAEYFWPLDKLKTALETVVKAGKIPQFQWLISPAAAAGIQVDNYLKVIEKFPRAEIIVDHWGGLGLTLPNIKLAVDGLAIYNSDLIQLLRARGVSIIGLPLKLNTDELLSAVINSSPTDTVFEYQLWGAIMASHRWKCAVGEDNCNPRACARFVKFSHRQVECSLCGLSLWHTPGVDSLSRAKKLEALGIGRGLIQLADIPASAVVELIDYCVARINE